MRIGFEKLPIGVITLEESRLGTYGTGTGRPKLQVAVVVSQLSGKWSVVNMKYQTATFLYTANLQCRRYAL